MVEYVLLTNPWGSGEESKPSGALPGGKRPPGKDAGGDAMSSMVGWGFARPQIQVLKAADLPEDERELISELMKE